MLSLLLAATVTLAPPATMPQKCEAHLVSGGVEHVVRCGAALDADLPARGWIESDVSITPFLVPVDAEGSVRVSTAVPAGKVTFPKDRRLAEGERVRLVSLLAPREGHVVRALFTRDVLSADAEPRMPAGPAVAMLLDARGRAVSATPIFSVRAGGATEVWPSGGSSTVIAWLARPRAIEREEEDRLTLKLAGVEPDALVHASDSVFALWSRRDPGEARIVVDSDAVRLARDAVNISRTSVVLHEAPLQLLPTLTVTIAPLPGETQALPMTLTIVETARSQKLLRTLDAKPGAALTIPALPAVPLTLRLRIGDFILRKAVDLTSGEDAHLDIPLEPLTLSGKVYLGNEPARAIVRIQQGSDAPLETTTGEDGAYSFTLWQPSRFVVDASLAGQPDAPPFSQLIRFPGTMTLDIRIPANTLRVRVYDATTGKAVGGAIVFVHNRWTDESGREGSVAGSVVVSGEVTQLPPQRPGTTEIRATAAGYSEVEPIVVAIDAQTRERVFEIPMTAAKGNAVTIRLPDQTPAAGAELALWSREKVIWSGRTDDAGRIAIPNDVAQQPLIVRHRAAASDGVLFGSMSGGESLTMPVAAPPLTVRVVHKDGSAFGPLPAKLSLWLVGGVRWTGPEAGFATWSFGGTGPDGTTILYGLRPQPLRVLATFGASPEQIATGTFDGLATTIPYPWPAIATVTLADE